MEKHTKRNFSGCVYYLLENEHFFASLSRYLLKVSNLQTPTLGIRYNKINEQFEMHYNPEYFFSQPIEKKIGLLKHEFYHIVFNYFGKAELYNIDLKNHDQSTLWNIASDLAINSLIPRNELPDNICMPGEAIFKNLPLLKSSEWYYSKINESEKLKQQVMKAFGEQIIVLVDDHEGLNESLSEQEQKILKEQIKKIIKKSAKECKKSWGSVSQHVIQEIDKLVGNPIIDCKQIMKYFLQTSQKAERKTSIRKINKRFPYIFAGVKSNRQANVCISVDQSGSVGNDLLIKFFKILDDFAEFASFTVIPFDCSLHEQEIKRYEKGKKMKFKRVLGGGTDFNIPTQYVNEHKEFGGHIILTDMQAPAPIASRVPRVWITCESIASNPPFQTREKIAYIKDESK